MGEFYTQLNSSFLGVYTLRPQHRPVQQNYEICVKMTIVLKYFLSVHKLSLQKRSFLTSVHKLSLSKNAVS